MRPPNLTFSPPQRAVLDAYLSGRYRYLGFGGAIRGGKTFGALGIILVLARIYPGSRWAIVRKDLPTIRRNVLPSFAKLRALVGGFCGPVRQDTWTATCTNGSALIFFPESLDTDPDLERWKGLEVNGFVLEEASELAEASFHKAIERAGAWVIPPTPTEPEPQQPGPVVLLTFNPCWNWVRSTFYEPHANGTLAAPYFYQRATIDDNPGLTMAYKESLRSLPELEYQRFVLGNWDVVQGRYFDELDERVHIVPPIKPQPGWPVWSSYDWGFAHPFAAGAFAQAPDGTVYLLDSCHGHRLLPDEQADRILARLPAACLKNCYAGHDIWNKRKAEGGDIPVIAEVLYAKGVGVSKANIARELGWQNLRRYLTRKQGDGSLGRPRFLICDTLGNRRTFEVLNNCVRDPNDPEDVLKMDADPEDGQGGDDPADMVRYGLAARIYKPRIPEPLETLAPDRSEGQDQEVIRWQREIERQQKLAERGTPMQHDGTGYAGDGGGGQWIP